MDSDMGGLKKEKHLTLTLQPNSRERRSFLRQTIVEHHTHLFERQTLVNKLSARRRFYTANMKCDERVLQFATPHLATRLYSQINGRRN